MEVLEEKLLRKRIAWFGLFSLLLVLACAGHLYMKYAYMEDVSGEGAALISAAEAEGRYEVQLKPRGEDVQLIVTECAGEDGLGAVLDEMIAGSSDAGKLLHDNAPYLLTEWIVLRDNSTQKMYKLPTRYFPIEGEDMTRRNSNAFTALMRKGQAAERSSYEVLVYVSKGQREILVDTGRTIEL